MADERFYVDNDLDLTLECQRSGDTINLSDYSVLRIYYKKPSGTTGYWSATLSGTHQLTYSATNDGGGEFDIDEAGIWRFYAYVEYNSGAIYQGNVVELEIHRTWDIQ